MGPMKERNYYSGIWEEFDEEKALVFISGPRQAGKTTFAKEIASSQASSFYFNYDIPANKALLLERPTFFEEVDRKGSRPLVILDEIHKYQDWKNYLKGIFDGYSDEFRFIVAGSGRLDVSRKKGDSLAGRYLHFHLFPFTLGEMFAIKVGPDQETLSSEVPGEKPEAWEAWDTMYRVSGFPEPFLAGSEVKYRRWAKTYHARIIRDDIRGEHAVRQMDTMEALYGLLPERVGAPFSASSLSRILKVSHKTVSSWIDLFQGFLLIFKLKPYSKRLARSLVKEPKIYFYDYRRIPNAAVRFENMVAVELHRAVTLWTDYGLADYRLFYLRNKDREEVDFLVTKDGNPQFMVETKLTDPSVSAQLRKYQDLLNIPAVQLVSKPGIGRKIKNGKNTILVIGAADWLSNLS